MRVSQLLMPSIRLFDTDADFYALAGVAAIRALDGPRVAFHPGRIDDPPELVSRESVCVYMCVRV